MVSTPDQTPDTDDPGDETTRRFRFQHTYAAVACCSLLDDTHDTEEVFCEHHEDVLLKHKDGSFSGLQIKTRASDQDVWRANDEALVGVFVRFAKLEAEFPNQFRTFRFLTNHPLHAAANGRGICHILACIRAALTRAGVTDRAVNAFLKKIAREAECTEEVAYSALRKSSATDELPKLADVQARRYTRSRRSGRRPTNVRTALLAERRGD